MAGKSPKTRPDRAADTLLSPPSPAFGDEPERGGDKQDSRLEARSSERAIPKLGCLTRHEVYAYLGRACPRDLRARVKAHAEGCVACGQWIRHLDDDILDYMSGQRPEAELARMDAHLDACSSCRDLMHHVVQSMAQSWTGEERADGGDTTFAPGAVVKSRYRIESFVGRGGMGEVYEAYDQLMDRRVALKTVLCSAVDRPRAARRFKEEVRNAQRVGHPHVCRIYDLQEHSGLIGPPLPFFTMEFVDGERLGNRLDRGPLPLADARAIALQLLSGLEAAHARGVLHLDFKSDNVMLRRGAERVDAVIMDFGLSRGLGESRLRTSDRRQFAGTLSHMAVEQLECRDVLGPPTDVYGFGVVLYEMLTRSLPFDGDSLGAILLKQLKERPKPPSRHSPGLSPELDRFVLKCLHNNPRQRFADAGEALAALSALESWSGSSRGTRLRRLGLAAALVTAGAGVLLPLLSRESSAPEPALDSAIAPALPQPAPAASTPAASASTPAAEAERAPAAGAAPAAAAPAPAPAPSPRPQRAAPPPAAPLRPAGDSATPSSALTPDN